MANKILWIAETPEQLMTGELGDLADGGLALASFDYPNNINRFRWADFQLKLGGFAAVPLASAYVELHFLYSLDGFVHADGSDGFLSTPAPSGNTSLGAFLVGEVNGEQHQPLLHVPLLPYSLRVAVLNKTGVAFGAGGHSLDIFPYNEELQ